MKYQDRYTTRNKINDEYVYYSSKADSEVYKRLGLYEDIGYSPLELINVLIESELSKGSTKWDLDKIERWQGVKNHIDE